MIMILKKTVVVLKIMQKINKKTKRTAVMIIVILVTM